MSTKTISVRLEAYERLAGARRHPRESFSDVILRAEWKDAAITGAELLALLERDGPTLPETALDEIDRLKAEDPPPQDKWRSG